MNEQEKERRIKIRRFKELDKKQKLTWKEIQERERLIDDIVVFYDSKRHRTHISGGGIVSLWLRYIEGNKKWKKKKDETVEPILNFEKKYNVKLSCKDLDNSVFTIGEKK